MKFLQVIDSSFHGGAETHTRLLSKELLARNHEVILACPPGEYWPSYKEIEKAGGRVIAVDLRKDFWRGTRSLRELIQSERVNVVHAHKHRADFACALASRGLGGVKKISTIHNLLRYDVKNPFVRWAYYGPSRWALNQMDFVFTVCGYVAGEIAAYFGVPRERLVPLVNGIDVQELEEERNAAPDPNQPSPKAATELWIACVGRLSERKGQDLLLRSFGRLAHAHPQLKLILVGEGPSKDALLRQRKEWGLEDRVIFTGRLRSTARLVSQCDIYVQPSRWDPVPRALLEAMALGVPVIAAGVTGIPEIIEDGQTGLLMTQGNGDTLTPLLQKFLDNPALRQKIGELGAQKVRTGCTMKKIAEDILAKVTA